MERPGSLESQAVMPLQRLARLLFAAILLQPAMSWADEDPDIVVGCHFSIGEFGYEAINMCVRENQAARAEVLLYPPDVQAVIARCVRRWEPEWVIVKRCVDKELAAAAALEAYAGDHGPKLDLCRERFRGRGDARIKACVEQAIEAEN